MEVGGVSHSVTNTKVKPARRGRKREYIPRRTRKFQLRVNNPEDIHVGEILDYARSKKQEVTMIRQGVALEYSLQRGDVSLLLERHPWILEALKPMIAPPPNDDGAGRLEKIESMLELALANQKSNTGYTMASQPPLAGLQPMTPTTTGKQIASPNFALPVFDDDDDELPTLKLATSANRNEASKNFLRGLSGLH